MAWDDMDERHYRWPEVQAVRVYREAVKSVVLELIDTLPLTLPITWESPWWIILMGIEHERIHIETSSVLHRQMPLEYIRRSDLPMGMSHGMPPANTLVDIPGSTIRLGREREGSYYGWDNEFGRRMEKVENFRTSKMLVSNAEYLPFVQGGGYEHMAYWNEEGEAFLARSKAKHPLFWVPDGKGHYRLRLLDREIDLPMDWPVEVNCLEAEAFCRYKSETEGKRYRLPTEAEWRVMAERSTAVKQGRFDDSTGNVNFSHVASSVAVNIFLQGDLYDVVGNVWQWTSSPIDGYEGFEPHPAYDDFSTPTFDGKHNLIKGGSWASTGNETLLHSRYAFRRHFYQHAGFRYVQTDEEERKNVTENIYETDALVAQYCEFQYGEEYFGVQNFAKVCAEYAIAFSAHTAQQRALDLGCATGRASFELARVFDEVTGIDFSARFIQVGVSMRDHGRIAYARTEEGEVVTRKERTLKEHGLAETAERVQFWQGDACNLKPQFAKYDLILATNLIDRLYEPERFLSTVHERLNAEGVLVLTSPYTWLEEYTSKEHWLGGYYDDKGKPVRTIDALKARLAEHFDFIETFDVPFVIRETARKYQHTIAQMSVWRLKRL
jgi:5-histidylcysteine sulfoxide synthase/putative 4-mercaptohistidine N1-methyltranferase